MDQVDTLHVDRHWCKVLCCSIMTHLSDFEFKVTDFEISCKALAYNFQNCIFLEQMDGSN